MFSIGISIPTATCRCGKSLEEVDVKQVTFDMGDDSHKVNTVNFHYVCDCHSGLQIASFDVRHMDFYNSILEGGISLDMLDASDINKTICRYSAIEEMEPITIDEQIDFHNFLEVCGNMDQILEANYTCPHFAHIDDNPWGYIQGQVIDADLVWEGIGYCKRLQHRIKRCCGKRENDETT